MLGRGGSISMATLGCLQSRWALCPSVVCVWEQQWTAFLTECGLCSSRAQSHLHICPLGLGLFQARRASCMGVLPL